MTAADNEINQAKDVCDEDNYEHNIKCALPAMLTAGHVLSYSECSIESLILRVREGVDRSGVVPEVDEGRV